MAEVASAFVTLVPSFKGGGAAIAKELDGPAERAGRTAGKRTRKGFAATFSGKSLIPGAAIAAGVAGFGILAKGAIDAAADAEQSVGATESIFGRFADKIINTSKRAATQYGLDANAYRESANLIGAQLKNQGVSADKLAGATDNLIRKGADLSSMFGGTTQEAVEALSSAFKGEMDPIERYGISLNDAKIKAELSAMGADKLTGKAAALARQQAITNLVFKQSKDAQGNFQRETDTTAHKQQVLAAKFKDVKTTLGTMLLPAMNNLLDVFAGALPKVEGFIKGMQDGTGAGGKFVDILRTTGDVLGKVGGFISDNANTLKVLGSMLLGGLAAFQAISLAVKVYTAYQIALNAAMTANPIGIVIVLLGALVGGLIYAYKNSETFRDVVNGAWDKVKVGALTLAKVAVGAFRGLVNFYLTMVSTLVSGAAKAFGWVPGLGPKLKAAAGKVDQFKKDANAALAKVERNLDIKASTAKAQAAINELRRKAGKPVTMEVFMKTRYTAGRVNVAGVGAVNAGQRATGGPVHKGRPYVVGEKRPELFVPRTDGYIVPRVPDGQGGGSGMKVDQHFYGITDPEEAAAASVNRLTFAARLP